MRQIAFLTLLTIPGMLVWGCGEGTSATDAPATPPTVYASIQLANAPALGDVGNGPLELTQVDQCHTDPNTGLFQAAFSAGPNKPTMQVKIKGFQTTSHTYNCAQASDNKSGSVGNKFDSCMVQLQTLYSSTGNTLNTYAMYRDTDQMSSMSYMGTCEIQMKVETPKVSGVMHCTKLIQTKLDGRDRNPLDTSVTMDIAEGSTFSCTLR